MTKQTFSTGSYTDYTYDDANRPTDIHHKKSGGTTIDRFQYVYDGVGNVTERTDTSGNAVDYTYDNADQLTGLLLPRLEFFRRANSYRARALKIRQG